MWYISPEYLESEVLKRDTIYTNIRIVRYLVENLTEQIHNHHQANNKILERD